MSKPSNISVLINGKKQITISIAIVAMIFSITLGCGRWYLNTVLNTNTQKIQIYIHNDIEKFRDNLLKDNLSIKENLAMLNTNDKNLEKSISLLQNNTQSKVNKDDMYQYVRANTGGIYHALDNYKRYCCANYSVGALPDK